MLNPNDILIITPHSGTQLPPEIDQYNIKEPEELLIPVDKFTDLLYNVGGARQFIFPYIRSIIDVNQEPLDIDNSIPFKTIHDKDVYFQHPNPDTVNQMLKHHKAFHDEICNYLDHNKPKLIIDGHSTNDQDEDDFGDRFTGDITISNFQSTKWDSGGYTKTCSDKLISQFADYLSEYIPNVKINTDYLTNTYGYIEELYSKRYGIPLILIEINERIYQTEKEINQINEILTKCLLKLDL